MIKGVHPFQNMTKKGKRGHLLFCFMPQLLFVMLAVGVYGGGGWLLISLSFFFIVMPLLDLLTDWQSDFHFEKSDFSPVETSLLQWNTRLYALFYMGSVIWLAISIQRFTTLEAGLLIAYSSLLGGIAFAASHELLHAKEKIDQILQRITTSFLFYPHYKLIHIRSHHVHAGTEHDENTAWLNENIYAYIFRTIPGSMIRSWQMEASRSASTGIFQNKMFSYAVGQVVLLPALYLLSGPWGLAFYVAHLIGAHIILESVNYIQHYGLLREQRDGKYEKTSAEHSWDTYHFFSSYMTFRVGHHACHHIAVKPYYLLDAEPQSPKLPMGFFWAIPILFLPPWWRRVINPRFKETAQPAPV